MLKEASLILNEDLSFTYEELNSKFSFKTSGLFSGISGHKPLANEITIKVPWWPESVTPVVKALLNASNLKNPGLIKNLLTGKALSSEGGRDNALQSTAWTVYFVRGARTVPVEDMVRLFIPSWKEMQEGSSAANPAPDYDNLLDKLRRARAAAQEDFLKKEQVEFNEREYLAQEARAVVGDTSGKGLYSEEELQEFTSQQGCDVKQFQRRWIIQKDSTYFVFVNGKYVARSKDELQNAIKRDLAPAPVDLQRFTKNGPKRKTLQDIMEDYGSVAQDIWADLALQYSKYDANTGIFHEAVCPIVKLSSKHTPEIDRWLRLLGGDNQEKLLDWLATVTDLSKPTCAVYLYGPHSTGKSMLAHGVASLWNSVPTELGRILESFNQDLARCPVVLADEHIPFKTNGRKTSGDLRDLISSVQRTLSRKFKANATLKGAIRLILLANNEHILEIGDEDLGVDDIIAVAHRFFPINVSKDAADYLESLGGRTGTVNWVSGDRLIARHLLWLKETRTVEYGGRFIVSGTSNSIHQALSAQGRAANVVIEWLLRAITYEIKGQYLVSGNTNIGLLLGNNKVLVNTGAVSQNWDQFIKGPPLTSSMIGRKLTNWRECEKTVNKTKYHVIPGEVVISWADKFQAGKVEEVAARIRAEKDFKLCEEPRSFNRELESMQATFGKNSGEKGKLVSIGGTN